MKPALYTLNKADTSGTAAEISPSTDESISRLAEVADTAIPEFLCEDKTMPSNDPSPSTSGTPTLKGCERCKTHILRVEQLQDSCRKVKRRRALLQKEIRHLRKENKELRKVGIFIPVAFIWYGSFLFFSFFRALC